MYDYIIIGCGITGSFIARELSKYDVRVLVVDGESDLANQTTMANSAIVHSGYDPKPDTLKAKLNVRGNKLYKELCEYYDVEFNQLGSLTVAFSNDGIETLEMLKERAKVNGVDVKLLSQKELLKQEPSIKKTAVGALLAPTAAIVYPWQITYAIMDHAISNGVELKLNTLVTSINKTSDGYEVVCNNSKYQTKNIVNCGGVHAVKIQEMIEPSNYQITPRKGEYYVLERGPYKYVNHIIFPLPSERGKGVLANPISEREILIGPTSEEVSDYYDVSTSYEKLQYLKDEVLKTMENLPVDRIMRSFSGLRASSSKGDFIIEESTLNKGLYHVMGIESPGFASAPAIAEYLGEIANFSDLKLKDNFVEYSATTRIRPLSKEERYARIEHNDDYGKIVCRCEQISKQEVVECIRGNVGATTVKGVKKRVRPGQGKCQGGFCEVDIVKIIAEELKKDVLDVCYDGEHSKVLIEKSKERFKDE